VFLSSGFGPQSATLFDWETLFADYRFDPSIGHYTVRERLLSHVVGTWLTRDPLSPALDLQQRNARFFRRAEVDPVSAGILHQHVSLYEYCLSAPTAFIDSLGLKAGTGGECTGVIARLPYYIGGASFAGACNNHDLCYDTCGADKDACDAQFLKEMLQECYVGWLSAGWTRFTPVPLAARAACVAAAYSYYGAVALVGKPYYDKAQEHSCWPPVYCPPNPDWDWE
jgi:hypothetical protein